MFNKVLVANRGEIAVRIIRALRELDIYSVAVYSTADKEALHTELADHAICIGGPKVLDSYANPVAILSAALSAGCDAIHPGYGFLSEKADFVELCEEAGITFIGPNSHIIETMGNKHQARLTMIEAGVPVTPGSKGLVHSLEEAKAVASDIGYPLMIKASDGGGGKGMRMVNEAQELKSLFLEAQAETKAIYGNKDLYIEKMISEARHIEVQLLGDHYGNVIHLGERDCSIQRNHQKVLEMAPAMDLNDSVRHALCQAAVKACEALNYTNAGTVEFLVDKDQKFYFMEMNTRLQVEHPVSEMVTGVDIVKEQLFIAMGRPLTYKQEDITFNGFAIECRLNAEDPMNQFRPSSGHVSRLILPSGGLGLRVESCLYSDYTLPPFYDSMIAKIITHQPTVEEAFAVMRRALVEVVVDGLTTNVELLEALADSIEVMTNQFHTKTLETNFLPQWLNEMNETASQLKER